MVRILSHLVKLVGTFEPSKDVPSLINDTLNVYKGSAYRVSHFDVLLSSISFKKTLGLNLLYNKMNIIYYQS